ncbi:MAG: hypothetical protein A2Z14_07555 [Chloroflexi bacterium RBG_16_48_8]|nr:MAG: hypothetical protein A2Z14_07555 [Chloroflexi bacterium RBG_16_48_8]
MQEMPQDSLPPQSKLLVSIFSSQGRSLNKLRQLADARDLQATHAPEGYFDTPEAELGDEDNRNKHYLIILKRRRS